MSTTTSLADRARAERGARFVLLCGLVPIAPCAAFLIWRFGYDVHPHRVAFSITVTGIVVVFAIAINAFVYHLNMKRVRTL
jgi:hypothetical protein